MHPTDSRFVVLVTGSRRIDRPEHVQLVRQALSDLWRHTAIAHRQAFTRDSAQPLLISGACPTGVDAEAEWLWKAAGLPVMRFPAQWDLHGPSAGPRRNQEMVTCAHQLLAAGQTVRVLALPGVCRCRSAHAGQPHDSHGTTDCVRRAQAAGLEITRVPLTTL